MGAVLSSCEYCVGRAEEHIQERKRKKNAPKEPSRLIRVRLERAEDLAAADSTLSGGLSDPYVTLQFGRQRRRSPVVDNTLNPAWKHQEFEFVVTESELAAHNTLTIRVMDFDALNADDLLGTLELDMTAWTGATRMADEQFVGYDLVVPEAYADQAVNSKLFAAISFLTEWEAAASLTEEVWEVERWLSTNNSWSKTYLSSTLGDRPAWYCPSTQKGGATFNEAMPPCPEGYKPAGQWSYDITHGDSHGWLYATTCKGPWRKEMSKSHFVRRRLWVNQYKRIAQMEPEPEISSTASTAATSSTLSTADVTF
ncbi:C2 domain-containing protein [Achlya hypogyna]|uniref:C2 domain-containing protein n=1 Tax=Achlya hypogyna TaxID=1202772 RepID=A0A1V9ZQY8_ACHHY|nr:C2 domain-containing protein [Achlya hypogyna]